MASIDRIEALAEEFRKKKKDKNYQINTSSIYIEDTANELRKGNKNAMFDYTDPVIAPIKSTVNTGGGGNTGGSGSSASFEKKKWWQEIFSKGAFEDGYQFGDVSRSILGTATDIQGELVSGFLSPIEGIVDIGTNLVATAASGTKLKGADIAAEKIRKFADTNYSEKIGTIATNLSPLGQVNRGLSTPIKEQMNAKPKDLLSDAASSDMFEKNSLSGKYADKTINLVGYTGGMVFGTKGLDKATGAGKLATASGKTAISASGGNIGVTLAGKTLNLPTLAITGGMASGLQEANSKENVSEAERWGKAISSGLIEGTTEGMFGMFGVGGNEITDKIASNFANKFSSKAGKILANVGVKSLGESTEEFTSYLLNWLSDNNIIDKIGDADFSSEWKKEEVIEQMALAFASSFISQGGGTVLQTNSAINAAEEQLGRKLSNEEKAQVTQTVLDAELQELSNQNTAELTQEQYINDLNTLQEQYSQTTDTNEQKAIQEQIDTLNTQAQEQGLTNNSIENNTAENTAENTAVNAKQVTQEQQTAPENQNVNTLIQEQNQNMQQAQQDDKITKENVGQTENAQPTTEQTKTVQNEQKINENKQNYNVNTINTKAKEYFGTTSDFNEAGYITTDGELLDFSDKKYDKHNAGTRNADHRDIAEVLEGVNGTEALGTYMDNGAIRVSGDGIDLSVMPTYEQLDAIREWARSNDGNVYVDYSTVGKYNVNPESVEYTNANPDKIVNDIKKHFSVQNDTRTQDIQQTESSSENASASFNVQEQVQDAIAPLQETISELNKKIDTIQENIAPVSQDIVEHQRQQSMDSLVNEEAPIQSGLTTDEKQELEIYNNIIDEIGIDKLDQSSRKRYEYLNQHEEANTSAETIEENTKVESPLENRDIDEVGKRSVKAYQYENPEFRPYFQQEAEIMIGELDNSIKGERFPIIGADGYTDHWTGTTRATSEAIADLKDTYGYSYDQIRKGLNAIIEDNGLENNAVSKRLEIMIDERLRNGYKDFQEGYDIPANQDYINFLNKNNLSDYYTQANAMLSDENAPIAPVVETAPKLEAPVQQETVPEPQTLQVNESIPVVETNSQNGNTELTEGNVDIQLEEIRQEVINNKLTPERLSQLLEKALQLENRKTMSLDKIANLTPTDANTTPTLPNKRVAPGNKESSFYENITQTSQAFNETARESISNNDNVKYYQGITNEQSLNEAAERLDNGGSQETLNWLNKNSKIADATDVAEGWILLKRYQDAGDYEGMVTVAKKMRDIGTSAGQTVQAFNIMERMTPEGMVKYTQSELSEAFEHLSKNKTKEWIDKNKLSFELKPEETKFIVDNMKDIQNMNSDNFIQNRISEINDQINQSDNKKQIKELKLELKLLKQGNTEYLKRVKLAEIKKMMGEKIPPSLGQSIKAWMRISMLFNPKTQVRNVAGNIVIMPVNSVSDVVSTAFDKAIAKKTGVRTIGLPNIKSNIKGLKKGLFESYNDFIRNINTRTVEGDRFEIGEGKNFKEKTIIGKSFNFLDHLNSSLLDAGDRGFYEAAFTNSINNQMVLNNSDVVTQDMINIATNEALSRTWQDNNNYTKFVLGIRKGLNKIGIKDYGLGDVLIPFAKTPANLTKAIVDYSPLGAVKTIKSGINLKRALTNGQFDAQMQHEFVSNLGKATAGTMLYIIGLALAAAGMTSGGGDDDKDVKSFLKNTLGINPYSIEIGGHSFTYDWAQPVAAPFAMMADIIEGNKEDKELGELITNSLNTAGKILLSQSFMDSINSVFTNNDGVVTGLQEAVLGLPSRAIPTFSKQIADMTDGTTRQQYVAGQPLETALNAVKAKIPGLNETLAPSVDTLGNEIQKYGGDNNAFNVFFNPANVNKEHLNRAGTELYDIYKETGDVTIMPRVAPYSEKIDGKTVQLTSDQRAEFQYLSGQIVENSIDELLYSSSYRHLDDIEKAEILNNISNYAYNKAKSKVLGSELSTEYNNVDEFLEIGGSVSEYYTFTQSLNEIENNYSDEKDVIITDEDSDEYKEAISELSNEKKNTIVDKIVYSGLNDKQKAYLYKKYYNTDTVDKIVQAGINVDDYLIYTTKEFKADYNSKGNAITNSRKNKVISYVNDLDLSIPQKAIMIKSTNTFKFNDYNNDIIRYVNDLDIDYEDKVKMLKDLDMTVSSDGTITWKK